MNKLSRVICLLWKARKKEIKLLKSTIEFKNNLLNEQNKFSTIYIKKCDEYEKEITTLKKKIMKNGNFLKYRIQKYIPSYNMNPYSIGEKNE